jgi:hypothetical protein
VADAASQGLGASVLTDATLARVDVLAADWMQARESQCRGSGAEPAVDDHRQACLRQRRAELGALAEALPRTRPEAAVVAVHALPLASRCLETRGPEATPVEGDILDELGRITVATALGREESMTRAEALRLRVEEAGSYPKALVSRALARAAWTLGDLETARARFEEAFWSGAEAKDHPLVADVAISLVIVSGVQGDEGEVDRWRGLAMASLRRAGDEGALEAELSHAHGLALRALGRGDEAGRAFEAAVEQYTKVVGADDPHVGACLLALGDPRGLEIGKSVLGTDEPAMLEAIGPQPPSAPINRGLPAKR